MIMIIGLMKKKNNDNDNMSNEEKNNDNMSNEENKEEISPEQNDKINKLQKN